MKILRQGNKSTKNKDNMSDLTDFTKTTSFNDKNQRRGTSPEKSYHPSNNCKEVKDGILFIYLFYTFYELFTYDLGIISSSYSILSLSLFPKYKKNCLQNISPQNFIEHSFRFTSSK